MKSLQRYTRALTAVAFLSCMGTKIMAMQRYTQDELLRARMIWIDSEDRIAQLKYQADNNGKTDYIYHNTLIASFDAGHRTITTFLPNGKKISLRYDQFDAVMSDDDRA